MGNLLNEMEDQTLKEGRDVNVIAKQIPVKAESNTVFFVFGPIVLGVILILVGLFTKEYAFSLVGLVLAGAIFWHINKLGGYFSQLEQQVQQSASTVDNYMEQRVIILENAAAIVEKSIDLDKEVFKDIAKYRSGGVAGENRANLEGSLNQASRSINVALENYPELKSHHTLQDAMQQNAYLQKEITAARDLYNNTVFAWNREIFEFPFKQYVASKKGYTTRIPFVASQETKERSRQVFF